MLPLVLSPGFEPGLDASLAHCLYRLGYESMRRQSAGICPRSPLWIRPLVPNPALMLAVDAHTATRGMTGITGAEPPCSSRPFPHPVGRLTRNAVARVPGNLSRTGRIGFIGFAPTLPTEGWCESSAHRMMGTDDIHVSVEQTEAWISDTSRMVMTAPPGTPNGHGIVSSGVRESNPHHQFGRLKH